MILLILNLIACIVILAHAFDGVWNMNRQTKHYIRAVYVLMFVGAFGVLLRVAMGHYDEPTVAEFLMNSGIALMFLATRRRRERSVTPERRHHDPDPTRPHLQYRGIDRRAMGRTDYGGNG